jgi:hypothetical protein
LSLDQAPELARGPFVMIRLKVRPDAPKVRPAMAL